MTKTTRGGDGREPVDLDAAIADLKRKLASLEMLQRARRNLDAQAAIQRDLMGRRRRQLKEAEQYVSDSGALEWWARERANYSGAAEETAGDAEGSSDTGHDPVPARDPAP